MSQEQGKESSKQIAFAAVVALVALSGSATARPALSAEMAPARYMETPPPRVQGGVGDALDRLHQELIAIGATIVAPPREYPEYTPAGYYALFFKDLEGIKYEIVTYGNGQGANEAGH